MCGFIAQLVEHRSGIAKVTGSNTVAALIFLRLLLSSCLNWKIYCDDHSSPSFKICVVAIFFPIGIHTVSITKWGTTSMKGKWILSNLVQACTYYNSFILPFACFPWLPGAAEPLGRVVCPNYLNSFSHLLYPLGLVLNPEKCYVDRVPYMNELQI